MTSSGTRAAYVQQSQQQHACYICQQPFSDVVALQVHLIKNHATSAFQQQKTAMMMEDDVIINREIIMKRDTNLNDVWLLYPSAAALVGRLVFEPRLSVKRSRCPTCSSAPAPPLSNTRPPASVLLCPLPQQKQQPAVATQHLSRNHGHDHYQRWTGMMATAAASVTQLDLAMAINGKQISTRLSIFKKKKR